MEPRPRFDSRSEGGRPFNKKPFKKFGKPGERKGPGGPRIQRKRIRRVLPALEFKDTDALTKYLTEKGKILPRRVTRLNAKDQRVLTRLIKRARHSGLLPFQAS